MLNSVLLQPALTGASKIGNQEHQSSAPEMDTIDIIKNVKDDIEFADQFTVLESRTGVGSYQSLRCRGQEV